jgi:hypothetical protein
MHWRVLLTMEPEQFSADSAEDTMISRYRALYATAWTMKVSVECGLCGAVQSERTRRGARWIAMECGRCGLRSVARLADGAIGMDEKSGSRLDRGWFDGLDSGDITDRA